jgi:hypothetical protein
VISHTDKVCEVFPYHPRYKSIQEALIVQAAMAYDDPDSGETLHTSCEAMLTSRRHDGTYSYEP